MHEYGERKPAAVLSDKIASQCCPAGKFVYVVTSVTCLWYNFGTSLIRYFLRPSLPGWLLSVSVFPSVPFKEVVSSFLIAKPAKTFLLSLIPLEHFVAGSLDKDALFPDGDFTSSVAHSPCYPYHILSLELSPWSHLLASLPMALPRMLLFLRNFPQTLHSTKSPWVFLIHSMASTSRFCSG